MEPELSPKEFCRHRARPIQKIDEVDPLTGPKYRGAMRIITLNSKK